MNERKIFMRKRISMSLTPHQIEILLEIFDYIEKDFSAHMSIAIIAKKHGMSQTTLIKAYKELYSITPSQHRQMAIVRYTIKRLTQGVQLKTIALELGYADAKTFARVFKKNTGRLPSKLPPDWILGQK